MPDAMRIATLALAVATVTACGVEYHPAKTGEDSARAVAALAAARAESTEAFRKANTHVDTVVRVDTVRVRDTLPALGEAPMDSLSLHPPGAPSANLPAAVGAYVPPRNVAPTPAAVDEDLAALRARGLLVPVQGVRAANVPDTFNERRGGGTRPHQALDILAPRGTPVLAADDGLVSKLFTSKAGGLTVYVLLRGGRLMTYYAHLDRYRDGLAEQTTVRRGDVIGYVGSTGDASPDAPHLHFALAVVTDPGRWWDGTPLDPKPFLR